MICESFGTTPDVAERQQWQVVEAVLDYRAATTARDVFNGEDKAQAFKTLAANPRLLEVLAMMRRAQDGRPLGGDGLEREGMAVAQQYRAPADGDER